MLQRALKEGNILVCWGSRGSEDSGPSCRDTCSNSAHMPPAGSWWAGWPSGPWLSPGWDLLHTNSYEFLTGLKKTIEISLFFCFYFVNLFCVFSFWGYERWARSVGDTYTTISVGILLIQETQRLAAMATKNKMGVGRWGGRKKTKSIKGHSKNYWWKLKLKFP